MSTGNIDFEEEYYCKIIDFFQQNKHNSKSIEMWRNKSFMELMKILKRTHDKQFVRNAILLILTLSDTFLPDTYNYRGVNTNDLCKTDKATMISILKTEIINDYSN